MEGATLAGGEFWSFMTFSFAALPIPLGHAVYKGDSTIPPNTGISSEPPF
jgi:hypothetical protein